MSRYLAIFLFALAAPASASTLADDAGTAEAYSPLETPDREFESVQSAADYYLRDIEYNLGESGLTEVGVDREIDPVPSSSGQWMILITTDGYQDDSVSGEQWRVIVGPVDGGYRVLEAGIRYNCARGDNPGWSRNLCP